MKVLYLGRFLTGKGDSAGLDFAVGVFPPIKIGNNQKYEFSFEAFMFCDSRDLCETEVYVLFGNLAAQNVIRLILADFDGKKSWTKFSGQFKSADDHMFIVSLPRCALLPFFNTVKNCKFQGNSSQKGS